MSILTYPTEKNQTIFLDTLPQSSEVPPHAIRGAQTTKLSTGTNRELDSRGALLTSVIDWCAFTLPKFLVEQQRLLELRDVFDLLGLDMASFAEINGGRYGYKHRLSYSFMNVYYNWPIDDKGVHVEMSGQGCRYFENMTGVEWPALFGMIFDLHGSFARLDLAIDDQHGFFTVEQVVEYIRKRHFTSKWKGGHWAEYHDFREDEVVSKGLAYYVGSQQSRMFVRFYDKLKERIAKGENPGVNHWVRTEVVMRDERADAAAFGLMTTTVGDYAAGILKQYLNFREPSDDSLRCRWPLAKWWDDFLGDAEKIQLTKQMPDQTIQKVHDHLIKQWGPSISALMMAYQGDTTFLTQIASANVKRMTKKHHMMVQAFLDYLEEFNIPV